MSLRDFARIYLLGKQNDVPSKRSIGRGSYLCEFLPSSFESPISFLLSGGSTGAPCILLMSLFFLACFLLLQAVCFVIFLVGFITVLCVGNYFRAKRAQERQRQRRLAKLAGTYPNGDPGNYEAPQPIESGVQA